MADQPPFSLPHHLYIVRRCYVLKLLLALDTAIVLAWPQIPTENLPIQKSYQLLAGALYTTCNFPLARLDCSNREDQNLVF